MSATRLILASASPRRRELLEQLGVRFTCDPAHIDESRHLDESPPDYVQRMAREKALAVASRYPLPGNVILAADTSVVIDDTVLGKPGDRADALGMLGLLSGRTHTVLTAVSLWSASGMRCELVATEVQFIVLSRELCERYMSTAEPWDKAGAYGIQGLGGAFVQSIRGSYSSVVGLPLSETWQLLSANGIATALNTATSA